MRQTGCAECSSCRRARKGMRRAVRVGEELTKPTRTLARFGCVVVTHQSRTVLLFTWRNAADQPQEPICPPRISGPYRITANIAGVRRAQILRRNPTEE